MAIQLRATGLALGGDGLSSRVIGRITTTPVEDDRKGDYVRVVRRGTALQEGHSGYLAVLFEDEPTVQISCLYGYKSLDFLQDGYVVAVNVKSGFTRVLYRPESRHNTLFATERCNSNCIMCSQPPREIDDSGMAADLLRIVELIPNEPERIGITGGEPTLLKDGLVEVISMLLKRLPNTGITMLSNGRMYSYEDYVEKLALIRHPNFLTSIPLYANNAVDHDYIVQAKGAFDQTVQGFYNAAKHSLAVELRVVLHKQTIPGLLDLADYIYRNLPFVRHVALMGLENMGYVRKNWDILWIDPIDYGDELEAAVRYFYYRRVPVSIYNLPLCVLPKRLWSFARKSISDFKNIYLDECDGCSVREHCCGLFQSSELRHSRAIRAIQGVSFKSDAC